MKRCVDVMLFFLAAASAATAVVMAAEPVEISGTLSAPAEGRTVFEISGSQNLGGSIEISSSDGSQIEVEFRKWARAGSESQAKRFLDLIDLKLQPGPNGQEILSILTPSEAPWEGSNHGAGIDITVNLPQGFKIDGDVRFMHLYITGPFPGVTLESGFSPLEITRINGPVTVSASFASMDLSDIVGMIKAENRYGSMEATGIVVPQGSAIFENTGGSISLRNIKGQVEAYTSYSSIEASDLNASDGSVVLRTSYSPIEVRGVVGELTCETSFSPISISDANLTHGLSKIETSYSPIEARLLGISNSQLFIYNHYNNIDLTVPADSVGQIVASVDEGGKIRSNNIPLKPTFLGPNRLEGVLGKGQARIELTVSGIGQIDINGR